MKRGDSLSFYAEHYSAHNIFRVIMLLIEYFPVIFITIASPSVIYQYNHFSSVSHVSSSYFLFKFQLILDIKTSMSPIVLAVSVVLLFVFLLEYYLAPLLFNITVKGTTWKHRWFNGICCFMNDILIFRTITFYVMYWFALLFEYSRSSTAAYSYFTSFISAILLIAYIVTSCYHIISHCVILHLDNKLISSHAFAYPYDWLFSMKYDLVMLGLKLFCSIEVILFNLTTQSFSLFFINVIIASYTTVYFLYLSYNIFIGLRLDWFVINRPFIFLRIGVFLFMWYTVISYLLFLSSSLSHVLFGIILLTSFIWVIISVIFIWIRMIELNLYNGSITFIKMAYVLCKPSAPSMFDVDVHRLFNSIEFAYNFLEPSQHHCPSEQEHGCDLNSNENILQHIFRLSHLYSKTRPNRGIVNQTDHIFSDIIQLLYYFNKGRTLKYFCYYNTIIKKYKHRESIVLRNMHFLIATYLSKADESGGVLNDLFLDTQLHSMIKKTLKGVNALINSPKALMKAAVFFDLSNEISRLKAFALNAIKSSELNETKMLKDSFMRNISQLNKYCMLIHRFVIETLINEVLSKDFKLDIECFEDFLITHYINDKTLILSSSLKHLALNDDITLGKILKCGKEMIKYKGQSVTQIFPIQFRKEGIKLFSQRLTQYVTHKVEKSDNQASSNQESLLSLSTGLNASFKFVINSFAYSYAELFNYSFRIVPTIINKEMIINGFYSSNNESIIIFKECDDGELILDTYSPLVQNLLIFPPEWVEYLKSNNYVIKLKELFYKCTQTNTGEEPLEYECHYSYLKLTNMLLNMPEFNELYLLFSRSYTKTSNNDFKEKLINARDTKLNLVSLKLKYLFTITEKCKYVIFSIQTAKGLKSIRKTELVQDKDCQDQEDILNIYQTTRTMNNNSYRSSTTHSASLNQTKRKLLDKHNNNVQKISATFSKFSWLILVFNSFIILVCIIFLIVQIIQSQSLYQVDMLFYQFKTMQINFAHIFMNIFSNICIADRVSDNCSNAFNDYSNAIGEVSELPVKYSMRDYAINALKFQVNDIQKQYTSYIKNVHNFGDQTLIGILSTQMVYIDIHQESGNLVQRNTQISLEEGLQKFINSLSILNEAPSNFDSPKYAVHLITMKQQNVQFDNILNDNINEVQKEIYKIGLNYVNYFSGYSYGEQLLIEIFNKRETVKKTILYWFIGIVIVLHIILGVLCKWIMIIARNLFSRIIMAMILSLTNKEYKCYLNIKIDILRTLNELYIKNPNNLISTLSKARKDTINALDLVHYKKNSINVIENKLFDNDTTVADKAIDKKDMDPVLAPLLMKIYVLFMVFLMGVIVFDAFILASYTNVMLINKYVLNNVRLETQLYNNIALPQIMTLINVTQAELGVSLGFNHSDPDGVLNMLIRKGVAYKEEIFDTEQINPSLFPPLSSFFDYNCNSIIKKVNDNITSSVNDVVKADFFALQIYICDKFYVTSVPNFEFIYNENTLRSHILQDYIKTFTYEELFYFNEIFDYFDMFALTLFVVRPLRTYINEQILFVKISNAFLKFIQMISGYLVFDIIADVMLFLIIKKAILGKIDSIHENFVAVNKMFTFHEKPQVFTQ